MNKITWAALALTLSAPAWAQTPVEIVHRFYPKVYRAQSCFVAQKDDAFYCMKQVKTEVRDTASGRLMYLLFAGDRFNFATGKPDGSHVELGLAGMFVLKFLSGNDWELVAAKPKASVGSFGNAPSADLWTFHEFGPGRWGFLTEHSDMHQGHAGSAYVVYAHNGKRISESWLTASYNNLGAYGDNCEMYREEGAKAMRECRAKLSELESKIKIRRDLPATNGFYPLQLTLSGYEGRKAYRNQAYVLPFNAKKNQYLQPKNYPLRDKEY